MNKFAPFLVFMAVSTPVLAQEEVGNIRVPEWTEFQQTQKELVEEQKRMLGELREVAQAVRQININLLSWQEANQNAAAAGKDLHCDMFKTKYDPRVEWTVVALAVAGVYLLLNKFFGVFKKKEPEKGV